MRCGRLSQKWGDLGVGEEIGLPQPDPLPETVFVYWQDANGQRHQVEVAIRSAVPADFRGDIDLNILEDNTVRVGLLRPSGKMPAAPSAIPDKTELRQGSSTASKKPTPSERRETFASPQACFDMMVEALDKKDHARYLACFSTLLQNQKVGWLVFQMEKSFGIDPETDAKVTALLEKHGLKDVDVMGLMQLHDMPGGKGVGHALNLVGELVHDKAAFIAEMKALSPKNEKPAEEPKKPILAALKVDGDVATARIETEGDATQPIVFRKIDKSWVIVDK